MANPILITGAEGFIGSAVARLLRAGGFAIATPTLAELDLTDPSMVHRYAGSRPWRAVIHLAAVSHVPTCEKDPALARRVNVEGTRALVNALSLRGHAPPVVFASTAQVYAPGSPLPWIESSMLSPQNTYASTKLEAERLLGGNGVVLRLFNHTHRSQSPDFVLPSIYRQMKHNSSGTTVPIAVGNLDLYRDIGIVEDAARAFVAALHLPKAATGPQIFNICAGRSRHLRGLAEMMTQELGVEAEFTVAASRVRAGEPERTLGSFAAFQALTGWSPHALTDRDFVKAFLA